MKLKYLSMALVLFLSACGGSSDPSQDTQMPAPTSTVVQGSQDTTSASQDATPAPSSQDTQASETETENGFTFIGPTGQNYANYVLTFSDEFNGTTLNSSKWNQKVWYGTDNPTKNFLVENGSLKIWPQRDSSGNFFDRTIDTDGKFSQTYGFFEAEMKLPIGKGVWPAFWLYAHPDNDRPEIDIMEAYPGGGQDSWWSDSNLHPNNYGMTIHKANADYSWHEVPYATKMRDFSPYDSAPIDLSAAFHKYGVKWEPSGVTFYFDGKQIGSKYMDNDHYLSKPMYVLFDLWFGSASGTPDATTPVGKNNSLIINYVRVWKAK